MSHRLWVIVLPVRCRRITLLNILSCPRTINCLCPHASWPGPLLFVLSPFMIIPPRRTSVFTSLIGSIFSFLTKCFAIWCISVRNICPWWNASGWGNDKNGMSLRHQSGITDILFGFSRTDSLSGNLIPDVLSRYRFSQPSKLKRVIVRLNSGKFLNFHFEA